MSNGEADAVKSGGESWMDSGRPAREDESSIAVFMVVFVIESDDATVC